jgi:cation diffusion facilitator family transporter
MNQQKRTERLAEVNVVLVVTLALNFAVCVVKIVLGLVTGILAITADGVHSLGDSLSNVVGLLGVRLARRSPDERYPFGYDKFEAITTLVVASLISVTFFSVLENGVGRLLHPRPMQVSLLTLALIAGTVLVDLFIVWYEGGAGRRLSSELLVADAAETRGDVYVSLSVLAGVFVIGRWGLWWLDGLLTLVIAYAILRIIVQIYRDTSRILCDAQVVDPTVISDIVMRVPGVQFCHAIRTRGRPNGYYAEFHLGVAQLLTIEQAHDDVCHRAKEALHQALPNLKSALVHIEPDTADGRSRARSVFRRRDPYGHSGNGI